MNIKSIRNGDLKNLYIIMAHIDDFECSCLGYVSRHLSEYSNINLIVPSFWKNKHDIMLHNLEDLTIPIQYINLEFEQRKLHSNLDDVKDQIYNLIDFDVEFDILTHDKNDTHTDHFAVHLLANGLYKYVERYVTVYSPSSLKFNPNYFVPLSDDLYAKKKKMMDRYDIESEQSYSKSGYYLQSEDHYNIGQSYVLENFVYPKSKYYEIYRIYKWM